MAKLTENIIKRLAPRDARYDVRDDDVTGLVLRISAAGGKTWSVSYRNRQGRRQRVTIGKWPTVKLVRARELARVELGKVASGEDVAAERRKGRQVAATPILKDFIENEYKPHVEAHHKSAQKILHRLKEVLPWGKTRLDRLDARKVDAWRTKRKAAGISPSTINRDIADLKSLLSKAVHWGILDSHPLENLKPLKVEDELRVRYLDDDEEQRLRDALKCESTPDYLRVAVLVSLNTGLRRGELLGLDWSAISLEKRLLTVVAKTAKSSKVRHVPLNSEAHEVLEKWHKIAGKSSGPVFGLTDIKKSWATLRDLAELVDFRWHDLRHSFASKLVMNGIDLNTVRELMGHADIRMTLRYAHLQPEHKADAVEAICNG